MKTRTCLIAAFSSLALFTIVWAFGDGAPSRRTGAPGESTCTGCHAGPNLPAGNNLLLSGIPNPFTPGQTYTATLTLSANGPRIWGFELAVKDTLQAQAGTIIVTDPTKTQTKTGTVNGQVITYLTHTVDGNFVNQAGPASWSFNWTAPSSAQPKVTFYVAGLAGDNSGDEGGDSVFVFSFTANAVSTGFADRGNRLPSRFNLGQNYPNPFNATTVIPLELPKNGTSFELSIFNLTGQRVRGFSGAAGGARSVIWDGRDERGQPVASGIYLYTLQVGSERITRKMILVK